MFWEKSTEAEKEVTLSACILRSLSSCEIENLQYFSSKDIMKNTHTRLQKTTIIVCISHL